MLLSRWRRVATGVAAGVIVLCAALLGASFRADTSDVSVAADLRPPNATPIQVDDTPDNEIAEAPDQEATDPGSVTVIEEPQDLPDTDATAEAADEVADATETADDEPNPTDAVGADTEAPAPEAAESETDTEAEAPASEPAEADTEATETPAAPAPTEVPQAPLTNDGTGLGTGGGVDDAECALDRLIIYAGARSGGVAGNIRSALAQAGFGAACPAPVTVLASNCPLQFSGVLGAGSGYDPNRSYVAASASVDRETMTAVMGTVGYTGNSIDILDFGFVNPDRPGEQWLAVFIPPSFSGWENLAARAGVAPTAQSLCAPSGRLG